MGEFHCPTHKIRLFDLASAPIGPKWVCIECVVEQRDRLLAACEAVMAELDERNAQEGMALSLSEKFDHLSPGVKAMVAAIRKAKGKPQEPKESK